MTEFDIINKYFQSKAIDRPDIVRGIGDDAAIVDPPKNHQLVFSTDTLVESIHFLKGTKPDDLGYRSLAVNLSDLAAMGAEPAWVLLSLTLPEVDEDWLKNFSESFCSLAAQHDCALIGGNLAKGPLSITVQVTGLVPTGKALKRIGAKQGDLIYVSGELGGAQAGFRALTDNEESPFIQNFLRPRAQLDVGRALRDIATSCIDISDGLLADLQHILDASDVGATIKLDQVPVCSVLSLDEALTSGEDYQLCFTLPVDKVEALSFPATCIGKIDAELGLRLLHRQETYAINKLIDKLGYQHF